MQECQQAAGVLKTEIRRNILGVLWELWITGNLKFKEKISLDLSNALIITH
jgi:hypothetical protein